MTRTQFEQFRRAFSALIKCSNSASEKPRGRGMAEHYVGMLRANGGRSELCGAGPAAR
jgi:hypothetical protein